MYASLDLDEITTCPVSTKKQFVFPVPSGSEFRLVDCDFPGWGDDNCAFTEKAGVLCGKKDVGSALNNAFRWNEMWIAWQMVPWQI